MGKRNTSLVRRKVINLTTSLICTLKQNEKSASSTSEEMWCNNKLSHQLYKNRCNILRGGNFENLANFITLVIIVTNVISIIL